MCMVQNHELLTDIYTFLNSRQFSNRTLESIATSTSKNFVYFGAVMWVYAPKTMRDAKQYIPSTRPHPSCMLGHIFQPQSLAKGGGHQYHKIMRKKGGSAEVLEHQFCDLMCGESGFMWMIVITQHNFFGALRLVFKLALASSIWATVKPLVAVALLSLVLQHITQDSKIKMRSWPLHSWGLFLYTVAE